MKQIILIALLLPALGTGRVAVAQETNAGAAPAMVSLQSLVQKNIFDPTRSGRVRYGSRPRSVVIRTFVFRGTFDNDVAIFAGDGAGKGLLKQGDSINGFKVMKIPESYDDATVVLTDPSGKIEVLKDGESMRREDDGPWRKSDQPAPVTIATSETKADEPPAASSPGPAGESDILKKLRLKREQEDK
jgi:hypothetical protein